MGLKNKSWVPYKRKAESVEINIKDFQNQTIGFFKLYNGKTRDAKRVFKNMKDNYGFDISPQEEVSKELESKEDLTPDGNWLKKDLEW